ncbi:5-hydroxytryptamine receptor 4-like [Denticeps clupeoides]|uniref:5-hydroxytryptamine receptor 4-like n=1 Tax=Denticeps clupeoides TaxID=299321 RepID=UPI0010A38B22|nr:5-hydroxytryptamine receptor 4-like [Denticeps clupeoides]
MSSVSPSDGLRSNLTEWHLRNCSTGAFDVSGNKIYLLFVLIPITALAVLGNLMTMMSVVYFHHLQTPTNSFIVSLATADFLLAVLVMPFSVVRSVDHWRFGGAFCLVHYYLDVTLCTASIFNLSCVALDRYLAVFDPLRYPARMSRCHVTRLQLVSWLVPVVLSSLLITQGLRSESEAAHTEMLDTCVPALNKPYAVTASTVSFFLPMGFLIIVYGKIFKVAQKQARQIQVVEEQASHCHHTVGSFCRTPSTPHFRSKERKAAKTLGVVMGAFLLCWLPFFIINAVQPFLSYHINQWVMEFALWLGYANSSLNPFLYAFFNVSFRRAFTNILACRLLDFRLRNSSLSSGNNRQTNSDGENSSR